MAAIDFQDMRSGPDAYDLASLLWERTTLAWMTRSSRGDAVRELCSRAGNRGRGRSSRGSTGCSCSGPGRSAAPSRGRSRRDGERPTGAYLPGEIALVGGSSAIRGADEGFRTLFERRLAALLS